MKMWMKLLMLVALVCSVLALSRAWSQTPATLAGTWAGELDGLPGVRLTVNRDNAHWSGTAAFNLIKRTTSSSPAHVDSTASAPMESVKQEGNQLTFEVRRADQSVVRFRMVLKTQNEARLFRTNDEPPSPEGEGLKLVRVR